MILVIIMKSLELMKEQFGQKEFIEQPKLV